MSTSLSKFSVRGYSQPRPSLSAEGHGNLRSPGGQHVRTIGPPFRRRPAPCSLLSSTYCCGGSSALAGRSAEDRHNDFEVLVLRHQLAVLKRRVGRARFRRRNRLFMAALSRVLKGTETHDHARDLPIHESVLVWTTPPL
jgi:hypothetical protein